MNYVAYYRVSTDRQGQSGLGLEAQRAAVETFAKGEIVAEFTEVESGRKSDRAQLAAALAAAKPDRLAAHTVCICVLNNDRVITIAAIRHLVTRLALDGFNRIDTVAAAENHVIALFQRGNV